MEGGGKKVVVEIISICFLLVIYARCKFWLHCEVERKSCLTIFVDDCRALMK